MCMHVLYSTHATYNVGCPVAKIKLLQHISNDFCAWFLEYPSLMWFFDLDLMINTVPQNPGMQMQNVKVKISTAAYIFMMHNPKTKFDSRLLKTNKQGNK